MPLCVVRVPDVAHDEALLTTSATASVPPLIASSAARYHSPPPQPPWHTMTHVVSPNAIWPQMDPSSTYDPQNPFFRPSHEITSTKIFGENFYISPPNFDQVLNRIHATTSQGRSGLEPPQAHNPAHHHAFTLTALAIFISTFEHFNI